MPNSFSIVIPVYNEADNVIPLYQDIARALGKTSYEIIFVNDGSSDETVHCLTRLVKRVEHIPTHNLSVVTHQQNQGQTQALISGVKAAQFDWIITLDGDGQNDPEDILHLLDARGTHTNIMVMGHRTQRHDTYLRRLSSRTANIVRAFILRDHCPDTGCSLKLFPKQAFLNLPHFDHLHRFLPALFQNDGLDIINIPVNHRPRLHGKSKYGVHNRLWSGLFDLIGVYWLMRRHLQHEKHATPTS